MNALADLHPTADVPRLRKAAMVVQLLLKEGQSLPLDALPESAQDRLSREIGRLKLIDKATLQSVAEEFTAALDNIGLTAPGSMKAALQSLDGHLSAETMTKLRQEFAGQDPWSMVTALPEDDLLPISESECPEVCAVLMSKLETKKAAKLLGMMPGERARRIAYAMSRTHHIGAEAISRIGQGLAQSYCKDMDPVFPDPPESRVGAILNSSSAQVREQVLADLLDEDETFGEGVRRAIFTFEDLPERIAPKDVPNVTRELDPVQFITAMAGAVQSGGRLDAAAQFVLENLSSRMADSLRDQINDLGTVNADKADTAQTDVIAQIREAADQGRIELITPE